MEKHAAMAMITTLLGVSLVTSIAGILVATPAIWAHNFLRAQVDRLEGEIWKPDRNGGHFQVAQRLPLAARFSTAPWMFIAAPIMGVFILIFAASALFRGPTGLYIGIASLRCNDQSPERVIVLHLTEDDKLFLNLEKENWGGLGKRLSEIYSMRVHRTIYLRADDGVWFQRVADAIDIAGNAGIDHVELITPSVVNSYCPEPRRPIPQFSK